jgi:hypothetical protein
MPRDPPGAVTPQDESDAWLGALKAARETLASCVEMNARPILEAALAENAYSDALIDGCVCELLRQLSARYVAPPA